MDGGNEPSPTELDREKGLRSGWVIKGASDEASEDPELKGVEHFVDREERVGVAGAKTVRHFRSGEAETKESVLNLAVVEEVEVFQNGGDLVHPSSDDISREGNIADRRSQQLKTPQRGTRDASVERIGDGRIQ